MAQMLDCSREISEFELQSHSYVHFRTNTIRKDTNTLVCPAIGFSIRIALTLNKNNMVDMPLNKENDPKYAIL